jgi:kynurenine formamidase
MTLANKCIIVWAENGGIVGRGVLLDYVSWAESKGIPINCFSTTSITVPTLKEIASKQGTTFRYGDILFVRTGWTEAYTRLSTAEKDTLAATYPPPAIGLESSKETLQWIWDHKFAAGVGDQPSFEAWPCQNQDYLLHEWLLAGWGMPIGELFDLKQLSEECAKRKRWEFFFSSMPLKVSASSVFVLCEGL